MAPFLTTHDVAVRGLDPAHEGLVVAHMTDVHVGLITPERRIRRAVQLVNAAAPDLVLLTGDYVCYAKKFVSIMGECMAGLQASAGVVATLGNHDHWTDPQEIEKVLTHDGYDVLRNESVELRVRGAPLTVVGIDDAVTKNHDPRKAFSGVNPHGTVLTLTHCPELADQAVASGANLVVAGHTHGGQVHVKGVTERMYRRITKRRYLSGWYEVGEAVLYVNRGVGSSSVPLRAGEGARSEVAVFRLHAA